MKNVLRRCLQCVKNVLRMVKNMLRIHQECFSNMLGIY